VIFCTLFNGRYLPQGLVLYRSLTTTMRTPFVLYVLCMDEFSADVLARLNLPHLRIIRLEAFETDALRRARATRSVGEYCWTCTAPLMMYVHALAGPDSIVTYVDADIRFYSDPQKITKELGDKSILVHEHDFAPAYRRFEQISGRFNVGVVAVRNDPEGRACLERWHQQSLADCAMDPAAGKCGDQTYLDEWPERYPGLVISANPGIGLGPWNIEKHHIRTIDGVVMADGVPAVFYHFHAVRMWRPWLGMRAVVMTQSPYSFAAHTVNTFYTPYIAELRQAIADIKLIGMPIDAALDAVNLAPLLRGLVRRRLNFAFEFRPTAGAA
jgi:hypothetical protein